MADVNLTPRVRWDNCGAIEDKVKRPHEKEWARPRTWGSLRAEGSRNTDSYGGKDKIALADLCPTCAQAALDAAVTALRERRELSHDRRQTGRARASMGETDER